MNTDLAVNGDGANVLPPLKPNLAGSSGTASVHSHIATAYIEKVVYRFASGKLLFGSVPRARARFRLPACDPTGQVKQALRPTARVGLIPR